MSPDDLYEKGHACSFRENTILSKCTIGIVLPFASMRQKYEAVINERLLHKFNLSNVQIGEPKDFYGCEKDIMIISSFRNSVNESLGCFTRQDDNSLDLLLLRIVMSRSKKFLWFVGCMETLESMNDRTLFSFTRFFKGNQTTHKRFEDQNEWKGFKLSRVLFT